MREFFEILLQNAPVLLSVLQIIGLCALFWLRVTFVPRKVFDEATACIDDRMSDTENKLEQMKNKLENLPTAEDVFQLRLLMQEINGKYETLYEQNKGISTGMQRVENQVSMLMEHHIKNRS